MQMFGQNNVAAARKSAKYTDIEPNYMFQSIAVESLGPINASGCAFLSKLGRISLVIPHLFWRWQRDQLFVSATRLNAVLFLDSFVKEEEE